MNQFGKQNRGCSVRDIVFESLRLYPPTKRIYRQNHENGEILAVDVEYLHRMEEVWIHGKEFRPNRWNTLEGDTVYKEAWMPFGKGSFQCPAYNLAPVMIGILVGGMVDGFGGASWVLKGAEESLLGQGPLENERESFEGLLLRRVETNGEENRDADKK